MAGKSKSRTSQGGSPNLQAQIALERRIGKVAQAIQAGPAREKLYKEMAKKQGEAGLSAASKKLLSEAESKMRGGQ